MTLQSDASRGWTISEAIERTATPDQWDVWIAAKAAWSRASTPTPSAPGSFIVRSPQEIERLRLNANDAFQKAKTNLWNLLESERLVATGSREGPAAQPTLIHSLAWRSLIWPKIENSTVRERFGSKIKIYNVRIFPLMHSPDAARRLKGLSLAEAFRRFVLQDPEIGALGERVMRKEGHEAIFKEGQAPGPFVGFHWPLGSSAADLACDFVALPLVSQEGEQPKPSFLVAAAAEALADRVGALRRILIEDDVLASGTFVQTGATGLINRLHWAREGISIDVQNGDLCEIENHKPVPRWTGVALELPAKALDRAAGPEQTKGNLEVVGAGRRSLEQDLSDVDKSISQRNAKSPQRASIDEAIKALWPTGIPTSVAKSKRNQMIIAWQQENGRAVVSEMTIRRELKARLNPV